MTKEIYPVSKHSHTTGWKSFSEAALFSAAVAPLKRSRTTSGGNTKTDFSGCGLLPGRKYDSDAPQTLLV